MFGSEFMREPLTQQTQQPLLGMCSGANWAPKCSLAFPLTRGKPWLSKQVVAYVCARVCCVCAQVVFIDDVRWSF